MLTALVIIEGPLGQAIAQSLERAHPKWNARWVRGCDKQDLGRADVLIVDDEQGAASRARYEHLGVPMLVLGQDLVKPFGLSLLRSKAVAAAKRASCGPEFISVDPPLRAAIRIIDAAAARSGGILFTGPSGVGKDVLARRAHEQSGRKGAFVPLNCAAFSDGLAESALFGHARGAFTGAVGSLPGAFAEADRGTLFLDEVGELDARIQAKLLRVLEDGLVRPLGSSEARPVSVRVVAATNRDLHEEIRCGRFRSDLYYRLATFVVDVPPLRDRPGDLAAMIDRFSGRHDRAHEVTLGRDARELLLSYGWPGNVRELRNVIERVFALSPRGNVTPAILLQHAPELDRAAPREGAQAALERQYMERARTGQLGKQHAADELGVHRTTLWRKMKRNSAGGSGKVV